VSEVGVPKLRFAEFKGNWEDKPFSDFILSMNAGVSVNSGDRPAREGEYGILKTSCVTNGLFDEQENKVVLEHDEISRLREPVKSGTIIISRMNTPALVGANALVQSNRDNLFLPDRLWAAKVSPQTAPYWLGLVMADKRTRQKLSDLASGTSGSMKNISKGDVKAMRLRAPTLPEQQKIADFLGAVDARVGLLRRRRDALRAYKKGMMQRLFSQELRFTKPDGSPFPDWQSLPAHELFSSVSNKDHNGELPILAATQDGGVIPRDQMEMEIQSSAASILSYKIVGVDNFVISLRSFQGGIEHSKYHGICSPAYTVLKSNLDIATGFYSRLFKTRDFIERLSATVVGIRDGKQISFSAFSTLKLPYPHPEEQKKIADTLTALDAKIDAVTAQMDAMLRFKKGLLQQMFV
jgi:type I restriction enzyme, S subunit